MILYIFLARTRFVCWGSCEAMDKKKVLVKVHPEGKFVVDVDKNIDIADVTPNCRVALRNDSYTLHKILPNKVDPLVHIFFNL